MDKNSKTKKIYFKFILIFIGIFVVLEMFDISWDQLNNLPSICIFNNIFGKECLGCGTIRALWLILHGNFAEAFEMNQLIYVYIIIGLFIFLKKLKGE